MKSWNSVEEKGYPYHHEIIEGRWQIGNCNGRLFAIWKKEYKIFLVAWRALY